MTQKNWNDAAVAAAINEYWGMKVAWLERRTVERLDTGTGKLKTMTVDVVTTAPWPRGFPPGIKRLPDRPLPDKVRRI
jgi:hypothetical protein